MDVVWTYVLFILCLDQVFSLPAGKNITLTQLFSTSLADLPDMVENVKRAYNGMGVHAQENTVFLGQNPTMFRLHRPGFQHVARSVSLESNVRPGLYLRYKNYKFRLEQAKPTGLFEKDSTFIERHPFGADSISLELFTHPGWFVCHDIKKPFILRADSKVFRSKEFDQKCVFRQSVHKIYSGPKESDNDEKEEEKAAELLDSLVSQESLGGILSVKNGQKKSDSMPAPIVGTPESVAGTPHDIVPKKGAPPLNMAGANPVPKKVSPQASPVSNMPPKKVSSQKSPLLNMVPKNVPPQKSVLSNMPHKNVAPHRSTKVNVLPKKMSHQLSSLMPNMMPIAKPLVPYHTSTLAKMFPKPLQVKAFHGVSPALMRNTFQRNQQLNRYKVARMRYLNALRRKALAMKTIPRMQYAGYISGIKKQNTAYSTTYNSQNPMYQYPNKLNYASKWGVGQVGQPLGPGSMRPGKVLTMSRNTAYKTPPSQLPPSSKAPSFKFVAVGNVQEAGAQTTSQTKSLTSPGSGRGSGETPANSREPKVIDPKTAVYNMGDKCISIRFYNKIRKPVRIVSSMKRAGYLVTAETFKLKTIFKHARKDRKVHFYAQDLDDKDDILLNNNNVITVIPGPCDLPYRSIYLSKNGQFTNDEIETFLKVEEQKLSSEQIKKTVTTGSTAADGFSQWSPFGPCSASCGNGLQTRSRTCLPKRACLGTTKESRACILTPCAEPIKCIKTSGGNSAGKCCAMPFIFQDTVYDKCITHARTGDLWCATTPNYDTDKSWGFCKTTGRRSDLLSYRPNTLTSSPASPLSYRALVPNTCDKSCYNMCVPGCHVTCCSAHALAFPSI
ncbi:uncharacterized protein LOC110252396 isoform X2 [Exaiptasia diaphana]|uniref:Fibronectin type-II domain-containing protein n=1 Tax=Exaiptasia diaphana TaxID=2652724 RepID=A0A913Y502_EXADI|nr:uncharacterized protein LOC110252396 isoform X2 [Exaiptasia diaphana]